MQSMIVLASLVSELAGGGWGGGVKMSPLVFNVTKTPQSFKGQRSINIYTTI